MLAGVEGGLRPVGGCSAAAWVPAALSRARLPAHSKQGYLEREVEGLGAYLPVQSRVGLGSWVLLCRCGSLWVSRWVVVILACTHDAGQPAPLAVGWLFVDMFNRP